MTTLSLFDLATLSAQNQKPQSPAAREAMARLIKVADSMVTSVIEQFEKIQALDDAFAATAADESSEEDIIDAETAVVFRAMYEECTREAERVLGRIDRLECQGQKVSGAESLRTWYRRTMAMLSVSLDDIAKSLEDVRQGRVISGADVRNELHTRLHG